MKYGKIVAEHGNITHGKDGVPLNESDEPVFILRAQDMASRATLIAYRQQAEACGASAAHLLGITEAALAFKKWQNENEELVKVPD